MDKDKHKKDNHLTQAQKRKNRKTGFYYSFLTMVLLFCLIQIGYGAILNISNIISYQGKVVTLENVLKQAKLQNQDLHAEKKMVTSDNSLEGIARNNLKMAGKDEVLIIINKKVEKPTVKKTPWYAKIFLVFAKNNKNKDSDNSIPYIPEIMDEE